MFRFVLYALVALSFAKAAEKPREIKVVVISLFERGADTGDLPGEFQHWVEREKLDEVIPFPAGNRDLRMNKQGVLGICAGIGTARAAASIMALGLDPRFDLRKAYFVVAGIAGGDPADVTLGSAAWADWVVDGDLAHEIDGREIPADWPTGMIPLRRTKPYEKPRRELNEGEFYRLNAKLVDWAFNLSKDIPLDDSEKLDDRRQRFVGYPNAQGRAKVVKGDTLSASTFWHGKLLNQWANDWVRYYSNGAANYVTTAMEDTGVLQSLTWLAKAKKVDRERVLVLRGVSNFDMQPAGVSATESLAGEKIGQYAAYTQSLENIYRAGSTAVHALVKDWKKYRDVMPQ
jgi:purine nucleoside permease